MSELAKVGVLAVLDVMQNHAAEWLDARSANGQLSNERRDHRVSLNSEARAAVAELIEVAKRCHTAILHGEHVPYDDLGDALHRCGGAA